MSFEPDSLVIAGAGFSFNAGLPLASDFTQKLLSKKNINKTGPSVALINFLNRFVNTIFDEGNDILPNEWPELEDLFTLIDLSANSGHHLGPKYSASELRVVRRSVIVRMIRMLDQTYKLQQKKMGSQWKLLESFFSHYNTNSSAVLSLNWDVVFERGISRTQNIIDVDYGCSARACRFHNNDLIEKKTISSKNIKLLKPHGSVNWLYCDTCRELFWVSPSSTIKVAQTLFKDKDWNTVGPDVLYDSDIVSLSPTCPACHADALGTRFATFSYRKALDFPMHSSTWRTAEKYLKSADHWVFFGYSMPAADFEFKSLLKRVQLSKKEKPRISVITGGCQADETQKRYEKFFGKSHKKNKYFTEGLNDEVLTHLRELGVLREN